MKALKIQILSLMAMMPGLAMASTYSAGVLGDDPVLYYRLDEMPGNTVAHDLSTTGDNGTYSSTGVSLGVPGLISGDPDTAALFSGGHVSIPDNASIDFVNKPFSIEAWIDPSSFGFFLRIFDKVGASTPNGYGLDMTSAGIRMTGSVNLFAPFAFQEGQTYYVTATSDGAGTGNLYIDGNLIDSGVYLSANPFTSPASIGDSGNSPGCCAFDGVIDELAVYNYALSPQQVDAHYTNGAVTATPEPRSFALLTLGMLVVLLTGLKARFTIG